MQFRAARSSVALLVLAGAGACSDLPAIGGGSGSIVTEGSMSTGDDAATTGADTTATAGGQYHPVGFADPEMHGLAAKLQVEDCRSCHGSDLAGGAVAVSCDTCHTAGWRTDCVYCHGGEDSDLGAPPRDIDGTTELDSLRFRAHTPHVTDGTIHAAFDCLQCHTKPTDVLSMGHMFDDTPGASEMDFTVGLNPQGQEYLGQCGNLYCHGNGNGKLSGVIDDADPPPSCGGCHGYVGSPSSTLNAMSGRHTLHVNQGLSCSECHHATVDAAGSILQLVLHVNGSAEVVPPTGFDYDGGTSTCNGTCHGKVHFNQHW